MQRWGYIVNTILIIFVENNCSWFFITIILILIVFVVLLDYSIFFFFLWGNISVIWHMPQFFKLFFIYLYNINYSLLEFLFFIFFKYNILNFIVKTKYHINTIGNKKIKLNDNITSYIVAALADV